MPRPVPNTPEFARQCICGRCPTYPDGDKGFYCSLGVSDKHPTRQGCICPQCNVWSANDLGIGDPTIYFCIQPVA